MFERQEKGRSQLYRIDADGVGLAPVHACNQSATTVQGRPAFTGPDAFVFVSDRSGRPALWEWKSDTVRPLTDPGEGASDYGPAPVPSGGVVFFRTTDGSPHLFHLDAAGTVRSLNERGNQPWPLPDGRPVFHAHHEGTDAVCRLDEGGAVRLTPDGDDEGTDHVTPFPAPRGAWIAFTRAEGEVEQVWLMRQDGSERHALTSGDAPSSFPAWSPDGRSLVVVRGRPTADEASGDLWRLDLDSY